jgi:hypothetical protein
MGSFEAIYSKRLLFRATKYSNATSLIIIEHLFYFFFGGHFQLYASIFPMKNREGFLASIWAARFANRLDITTKQSIINIFT